MAKRATTTPASASADFSTGLVAVAPISSVSVATPSPEPGALLTTPDWLAKPKRGSRALQVRLPTRAYCAQTCFGYRYRLHRDPGGKGIFSLETDDPCAFKDDDAVLEFTASGRRASLEDMGRMDSPSKRATAMLASALTKSCPCVEALRSTTAPCGDQVEAMAEQRLLAVPWSSLFPAKITMPPAMASLLNRDMAGRVKRTAHIKSVPMHFVHEPVVEEAVDVPAT